jgi:hypothetical protein
MTDSPELLDSASAVGGDLTHYQEELARERNARTLNLRHRDPLSSPSYTGVPVWRMHSSLAHLAKYPYLDPEKAIATLKSADGTKISVLAGQIVAAAHSTRLLTALAHSSGFLEALAATIASDIPSALTVALLGAAQTIFVHCEPGESALVDGISLRLADFLQSGDAAVVAATLALLSHMCETSGYARDSVLCLGIQTALLRMALESAPSALSEECCLCLLHVFGNRDQVEPEMLLDSVDPLLAILPVGSPRALASVLDCFVAMSNHHAAIVHSLYEHGLFAQVVRYFDVPELVGPSLRLVGNMSTVQPFGLDGALVSRLIGFLDCEHAADAFWALSNLTEVASSVVMQFVTDEFIARLIEIVGTSSYDIQKECTFFMSTLIMFSQDSQLEKFIQTPIIDILVSMIGCGVEKVMLRCIDTLLKFVRLLRAHPNPDMWSYLTESDLSDRLGELTEQDDEQQLLVEHSEALAKQIQDGGAAAA